MKVLRETVVLSIGEILDITEVYTDEKRVYYGYNYRRKSGGEWRVLRRWDNAHGYPHVDVYDSSGKHVRKIVDKERKLDEIKDLIKYHGRRGVWRDNRD